MSPTTQGAIVLVVTLIILLSGAPCEDALVGYALCVIFEIQV